MGEKRHHRGGRDLMTDRYHFEAWRPIYDAVKSALSCETPDDRCLTKVLGMTRTCRASLFSKGMVDTPHNSRTMALPRHSFSR